MHFVPISFICLMFCLNLRAQHYEEQIPDGLILLRSDSIFTLNYRSDGSLNFTAHFNASFLDSVGALAYEPSEKKFYAFRYDNAHLVRFNLSGHYEDLSIPLDSSGKAIPNEDLTSAVIHDRKLYVLSYSTNSIFELNLDTKKYKLLTANIPFSLPNTLAWHPKMERLYILNQNGSPVIINPKSGAIEKEFYSGSYANLPRKKLLSYGKLWFGTDGRCFLLAGQEGILYELDTEKKIAYFVANINFNSPKDALAHDALISPRFIGKELLSLKIQPYQHQNDYLELEWYERNDKAEAAYYYCEKFNAELMRWEQLSQTPAYAATTQSNRYTYLDRMPGEGKNCYRLRIEYTEGFVAYSREVCFDKSSNKNGPEIRLSNSLVSDESGTFLHLTGYDGRKIRIEIRHCISGKKVQTIELTPKSEDESFWINLEGGAWYEIRLFDGKDIQRLKVYKDER